MTPEAPELVPKTRRRGRTYSMSEHRGARENAVRAYFMPPPKFLISIEKSLKLYSVYLCIHKVHTIPVLVFCTTHGMTHDVPLATAPLVPGNRGSTVHRQTEREPSFPSRYGTGSADIIWSPFRQISPPVN